MCKNLKDVKDVKDWPRWSHDNYNTNSNPNEKKLDKNNVQNLTELWNFDTTPLVPGDKIFASPIISEGLMYLLSVFGFLYVINISDGQLNSIFNGGLPLFVGFGPAGNAGSTPVIHGNYIYVATDDKVLRSYNKITGLYNPTWPPLVEIPVVSVSDPSAAAATTVVQASLSIADDILFVLTTNFRFDALQRGTVSAFNLNGIMIWSEIVMPESGAGSGAWSTPCFDLKSKTMYFGTNNPKEKPAGPDSDALLAIDYRTGKRLWSYQFLANDVSGSAYPYGIGNPVYKIDRDVGASPNLFDVCCNSKDSLNCSNKKMKLVGSIGKDAVYRAINRKTGRLVWERVITHTPTVFGGPSAAYHDKVIYVVASSDIDPNTQDAEGNQIAYPVPIQGYAESQGDDFFGTVQSWTKSKTIIKALNACNGDEIWSITVPHVMWANLTIANGVLYAGSFGGQLYGIDSSNGSILATYEMPLQETGGFFPSNCSIPTGPIVLDGVLYANYTSFISVPSGVLALSLDSDRSIKNKKSTIKSSDKPISNNGPNYDYKKLFPFLH